VNIKPNRKNVREGALGVSPRRGVRHRKNCTFVERKKHQGKNAKILGRMYIRDEQISPLNSLVAKRERERGPQGEGVERYHRATTQTERDSS